MQEIKVSINNKVVKLTIGPKLKEYHEPERLVTCSQLHVIRLNIKNSLSIVQKVPGDAVAIYCS